jgi:hypothetical protein
MNMNYLEKSDRQHYLDTLLSTYNLEGTVNFPTRIDKNSKTAIDNVCIHLEFYTINPIMNGQSDHHAQTIMICDIMTSGSICSSRCFRIYDSHNIFKASLYQYLQICWMLRVKELLRNSRCSRICELTSLILFNNNSNK